MAKELAELEYQKFNRKRIRLNDTQESDFDKAVKMIETDKEKKRSRKKKLK